MAGGLNSGVFGAGAPISASNIGDVSGVVLLSVPCAASVFVGAAVRMSGVNAINALADDLTNSNVIGFAYLKPTTTTCHIRVSGITDGIFTGLDLTKEYFLSDTVDGEITTTIPTAAGHVVYRLGIPFTATRLVVDKSGRSVRA